MKPATLCRLEILFLIVEIKTQTVKYCKISTYMINVTVSGHPVWICSETPLQYGGEELASHKGVVIRSASRWGYCLWLQFTSVKPNALLLDFGYEYFLCALN